MKPPKKTSNINHPANNPARQGDIVGSSPAGVWVVFESAACAGCASTCEQTAQRLFISSDRFKHTEFGSIVSNRGQIKLKLSASHLGRIIFQVYLLPLSAFVFFAWIAEMIKVEWGLSDIWVAVFALFGVCLVVLVQTKHARSTGSTASDVLTDPLQVQYIAEPSLIKNQSKITC